MENRPRASHGLSVIRPMMCSGNAGGNMRSETCEHTGGGKEKRTEREMGLDRVRGLWRKGSQSAEATADGPSV